MDFDSLGESCLDLGCFSKDHVCAVSLAQLPNVLGALLGDEVALDGHEELEHAVDVDAVVRLQRPNVYYRQHRSIGRCHMTDGVWETTKTSLEGVPSLVQVADARLLLVTRQVVVVSLHEQFHRLREPVQEPWLA